MPKRLLVVTQTVDRQDPNLGFFHRWIEELSKKAALHVIANKVGEHELPSNVEIHTLGTEVGASKLSKLLRYQRYLFRILPRVDAVFFHMCPEYVLAAGFWLAVFPKKSLLWYTHKSTTWKLRIAEKQVDAIFTASTLSFRLPSKKVEVTGHGIDTEFFKPAPTRRKRTKLVILTAGRISPVKKHEVLIEAALFLKQEGADFEVQIAGAPIVEGDAKYQEALERIVKERALSNEVRFLGAVPHQEIVEFYRQGVIFINLSETGSLDKAVLEAAACGLSVLTSNDAFKEMLPGASIVGAAPRELAMRIIETSKLELPLRDYVVAHHGLDRLLSRIADFI